LIDDFINSKGAFEAGKSERRGVFSNLLIGAHLRYGDIALWRE
jgi:hypothetical protein